MPIHILKFCLEFGKAKAQLPDRKKEINPHEIAKMIFTESIFFAIEWDFLSGLLGAKLRRITA